MMRAASWLERHRAEIVNVSSCELETVLEIWLAQFTKFVVAARGKRLLRLASVGDLPELPQYACNLWVYVG